MIGPRVGLSFFPVLAPGEKDAATWFAECLRLAVLGEELGYDHVQIVEHHGTPYGGYSPDPVVFLAAAAALTSRIRLITGAVIPAFSHPAQLAGRLAMLDNISGGRLSVGFARAFLPHEFATFGVDIDTSRERFTAGIDACVRLWSGTDVTVDDGFHSFGPVTVLPPPLQRPHPPVYVASATNPVTCAAAGRAGYHLQVVPTVTTAERLREMIDAHRAGWRDAGHPGAPDVQVKFTCYLDEDRAEALAVAECHERNYVAKMGGAVAGWATLRSAAYPGYEQFVDKVARYDFGTSLAADKVLAGTPGDVVGQLRRVRVALGEDISLSCQFNPGTLDVDAAEHAMRLFAEQVAPAVVGPEPVAAR